MPKLSFLASTLAATAILLLTFPNVEARIRIVPTDFRTIQECIDNSRNGDTVIVQPGRYSENIDYHGLNVTVASLAIITGDSTYIDSTIIDGNRRGTVVTFDQSENSGATLYGFTITNGRGGYGGGIHCGDPAFGARPNSPTLSHLKVINNEALGSGGGIYSFIGTPTISSTIISNNRAPKGAGIAMFTSGPLLSQVKIINNVASDIGGGVYGDFPVDFVFDYVLIANNESANGGGAIYLNFTGTAGGMMKNLTICHNKSTDEFPAITLTLNPEEGFGFSRLNFVNSIIYANEEPVFGLWGLNEEFISRVTVSYSDIEGGQDAIGLRNEFADFIWLDGNIDADPLFHNPDNRDYRLTEDSPCIDAGDPDSPADNDGTPADMGAFAFPRIGAWISGEVYNMETNESISGVTVSTPDRFIATSDSLGIWNYPVPGRFDSTRVILNFSAYGYISANIDTLVYVRDSLQIEIGLAPARFLPYRDSLFAEIDSGDFTQISLTAQNNGSTAMVWSASVRSHGSAGFEPFDIRDSIGIGAVTGDNHIEGVTFDGERFYVSGSNGDNPNLIYILDRQGELVGNIPQVGYSDIGYKDVEWDGEYLWGANSDSLYGISTRGRTEYAWADPVQPTQFIAYDESEGILWLAATTTNIVAFDPHANRLGRTLNRNGLRIYGLAWLKNDSDDANLYILDRPGGINDPRSRLYKLNTHTEDTLLVHTFSIEGGGAGLQSLYICDDYDKYHGAVLMTIMNRPANMGGDRLDVYQLRPNHEWLSIVPDHGEADAMQEFEMQITLRTTAEDETWSFEAGVYEGEVLFSHDDLGDVVIVPVWMTVLDPNSIEPDQTPAPSEFGLISAFPNPFNSTTTIRFSMGSQAAPTRLAVYDLSGRLVENLFDNSKFQTPNSKFHSVVWNAEGVPGGIYFIRLESGSQSRTIKTILMK